MNGPGHSLSLIRITASALLKWQLFLILGLLSVSLAAARGQDAPQARQADEAGQSSPPPPAAPQPSPGTPSYYPQSTEPTTYGEPGLGFVQRLPSSELGAPEYGVPYSSVFSLTGADGESVDPLRDHQTGLSFDQATKFGNAEGGVTLGGVVGQVPGVPFIYRALPPEDADLKVGPLYLRFNSLQADLLYSDNYRLSTTDRQSETLAIIALNMTLFAQITDDLQFSVNGTLFYLPIQNIVGLTTPSLASGYGFLFAALPLLRSQVSYDALIAGWDVRFADDFSTSTGNYSDSTRDSFSLFQGSTLSTPPQGKYVFHSGEVRIRGNEADFNNGQQNFFSVFANTVSAYTENVLPGDIDFSARAERTDFWYDQGNNNLPYSREDLYLLAQTDRPNMRFTTYASYQVSHISDAPGVYQIFRAGLFGPITDQLFLNTNVGYFLSSSGHDDVLWTLNLHHVAGEFTTEDLDISRGLSDFDDEVITTEYYRLNQVLGPTLTGAAFASNSDFQELTNGESADRNQQDVGAEVTWDLGPKTTLTLSGIFTHQDFTDGFVTNSWTGRLVLWRTITDTLFFRAFYQYQQYDANFSNRSYYENLIYLSLIKYFP